MLQHSDTNSQLLETLNRLLTTLKKMNCKVHIYWIPGHQSIPGNESADALAKQALDWNPAARNYILTASKENPLVSKHLLTRFYLKRECKLPVKQEWNENWQTSNQGRHYRKSGSNPSLNTSERLLSTL